MPAGPGRQDSSLPSSDAFAVTPTDGVDLTIRTRSVYVGGAGSLTVQMANGSTVTFAAVPAGVILPIRVDRVNSTGTTATNIVGLV